MFIREKRLIHDQNPALTSGLDQGRFIGAWREEGCCIMNNEYRGKVRSFIVRPVYLYALQ